jgi:hypothetical protein
LKRYVYWRQPDGRPYRQNDDKHAPVALLALITKESFIDDQGRVASPGTLFRLNIALKLTVVVLDPDNGDELNEGDSGSIVDDALRSAIRAHGGKVVVGASEFLKAANKRAGEYFRQSCSKYMLITSLSVKTLPEKKLMIGGCVIRTLRNRKKYPLPEVLKREGLKESKYLTIGVETDGRTIHAATAKALDAVNMLRAVWTLFATFGSYSLSVGVLRPRPLGAIYLGPSQTLHNRSDGKPVDDIYWADPDFLEEQSVFDPPNGWANIEKHRKWAMRRLERLPYRKELESLLGRYVIALDHTNLNIGFLQLWGILERMTDTIGARYDDTISRSIWVFNDHEIAADILESLRTRRNRYVHSAQAGEDRQQAIQLIKSFVEPHLVTLLRNDFDVSSMEEYGIQLSLPKSIEKLKKQRSRYDKAIRNLSRRR